MSDYVSVCALADLADHSATAFDVDGTAVAVVRVGGQVFAVRDTCTHAEVPLSEGTVYPDGTISCWLHGSRFDLRTGEPDEPPAWEPVATYPTRITDTGAVQIGRRSTEETSA